MGTSDVKTVPSQTLFFLPAFCITLLLAAGSGHEITGKTGPASLSLTTCSKKHTHTNNNGCIQIAKRTNINAFTQESKLGNTDCSDAKMCKCKNEMHSKRVFR